MSPAPDERAHVAEAIATVLLENLPDMLSGIKWLVRHPDDGAAVIEMVSGARFRVTVTASQ